MTDWRRSIRFENVVLSPISIAIDHLGMHNNLPGISEQSSRWLWSFTICRGRKKSDSSRNILAVTGEVLGLIEQNKHSLVASAQPHFDGFFTTRELEMWTADLKAIDRIARTRDECTWECE